MNRNDYKFYTFSRGMDWGNGYVVMFSNVHHGYLFRRDGIGLESNAVSFYGISQAKLSVSNKYYKELSFNEAINFINREHWSAVSKLVGFPFQPIKLTDEQTNNLIQELIAARAF